MALTQAQIMALANRLRTAGQLIEAIGSTFQTYAGDGPTETKQQARYAMTYLRDATVAILAQPIADLTLPPYTAPQVAGITTGLASVATCYSRIWNNVNLAQQPGLLQDENGNVLQAFSAETVQTVEDETKRLYLRMKTLLEAMP